MNTTQKIVAGATLFIMALRVFVLPLDGDYVGLGRNAPLYRLNSTQLVDFTVLGLHLAAITLFGGALFAFCGVRKGG